MSAAVDGCRPLTAGLGRRALIGSASAARAMPEAAGEKRWGRDSNPRRGQAPYRFSRPVHSTTLPPHRPGHIVAAHQTTVNRPLIGMVRPIATVGFLPMHRFLLAFVGIDGGPRSAGLPPARVRDPRALLRPVRSRCGIHDRDSPAACAGAGQSCLPFGRSPLIGMSRRWYIRMRRSKRSISAGFFRPDRAGMQKTSAL